MSREITQYSWQMGTLDSITVYDSGDEPLLGQCFEMTARFEGAVSKFKVGSEIWNLNHRPADKQTWNLSDDVFLMLRSAIFYGKISGGMFDVTSEPLSSLWNVTGRNPKIPEDEKLRRACRAVDFRKLRLNSANKTLTFLSPDTQIDLGGIAKGYMADRLKDFLCSRGVRHAVINLGGNVLCIGGRPNGENFKIGIRNPLAGSEKGLIYLSVDDLSVVTSGSYERHFIQDGTNYHHIINPSTGYPVETGVVSVTIVSAASTDADALSTVCFALGWERGRRLLESMDGVYGIFILNNGQIRYTCGARELVNEKD